MATLVPSFLIRSSSFLQVTRTTITSRMSSNKAVTMLQIYTKNDALQSGPDRIRTLVSMSTDSSLRVIKGKTLWPL